MRFGELKALLSKRWPFLQPKGRAARESGGPASSGPAAADRSGISGPRFKRRGPDRRRSDDRRRNADRRNQLVLAPTTWIEHLTNATRALRSDPITWLVGLFVTAAALAWFLPIASLGERRASFINGALVVVGSTAIILYQWRISSTAVQRAEDAKAEQALLRKSFDALQFKLQMMQSNFEAAIADCEDLRDDEPGAITQDRRTRTPIDHRRGSGNGMTEGLATSTRAGADRFFIDALRNRRLQVAPRVLD